ncbi:MAG: tetratricopeptide repeat protein [Minicystis sp.]
MRFFEGFLVVGLMAAVFAGCKGAPPRENAPEGKTVETAAPAITASASASDGFDGGCKGQECIAKCDRLGRPNDCYQAGDAYRRGKDEVAQNLPSAIKYWEKACAKQAREACLDLGRLYAEGDKAGVPQDVAKAIPLFTIACDLGRGQACDLLSKRAESGEGMPKDHAKAIALLAQGCAAQDYQDWTCQAFKKAYDAKDEEAVKAVKEWMRGCVKQEKGTCAALKRTDLF